MKNGKSLNEMWKDIDKRSDEIHAEFGRDFAKFARNIRIQLDLQEILNKQLNSYAQTLSKSIATEIRSNVLKQQKITA
ncbi:MAG: hypothetical protein J7J38_02330 [Candidatus Aenigmarchaeota archaeon]|nr:hypothetical protein [Candidatus Aenigmarchaeota archaeon]